MSKRQAMGVQAGRRRQPDPAVFDLEHLRQYTGDDRVLQRELVNLFLGHFAPVRTQLDAARSTEEWKFSAHTLKGSARSIGAPAVAALADKLDAIEFDDPQIDKTRLLDELDAAMAAFAREVKKTIG